MPGIKLTAAQRAAVLHELREHGYHQKDLAPVLWVSNAAVSNYLRGTHRIRHDYAVAIYHFLGNPQRLEFLAVHPEDEPIMLDDTQRAAFRAAAKESGYTASELAERLHISPATMSMYVHGKRPIPPARARELYRLLGEPSEAGFLDQRAAEAAAQRREGKARFDSCSAGLGAVYTILAPAEKARLLDDLAALARKYSLSSSAS